MGTLLIGINHTQKHQLNLIPALGSHVPPLLPSRDANLIPASGVHIPWCTGATGRGCAGATVSSAHDWYAASGSGSGSCCWWAGW